MSKQTEAMEPNRIGRFDAKDLVLTKVRIDMLKPGDTVLHHGELVTVGRRDLQHGGFMTATFRGDSYRSGRDRITKVDFPRFYMGVKVWPTT